METTTQTTDTILSTSTRATRPSGARLGWWRASGLAIVAAVAVNLVILAIGTAADASFVVVDNGDPADVTALVVAAATAIPLLAGFLVAALLARWRPRWVRPLALVAAAIAVVSVAGPFAADTDTGTAAALALMHVVVGAAYLGGTEAARPRA
jgi:Family of unknown function (DUF6069)